MNEIAEEHQSEGDMPRRDFLKTTVLSPALRLPALETLSVGMEAGAQTLLAVTGERMIPKFLSQLTIARMQQLFGENSDDFLGKPLQEAMPLFLDRKARERLPTRILQWSIERDSIISGLAILQKMKLKVGHVFSDESKDGWFQEMIGKIMKEPETAAIVDSCLGECVALEIHERAFPAVASDIQRMMQRKNLLRLQRGESPMELRYTPQIGIDAVVKTSVSAIRRIWMADTK